MTRICMYCREVMGYKCPRCGSEQLEGDGATRLCCDCGSHFPAHQGGETHGVCDACLQKRRTEMTGPLPAPPSASAPASQAPAQVFPIEDLRHGDRVWWDLPVSGQPVILEFRITGPGAWVMVDRNGTPAFSSEHPPDGIEMLRYDPHGGGRSKEAWK